MNKLRFSVVIALAPWRNAEVLPYLEKQDFPKNRFEIIIKKGLNVPDNRNNGVKSSKGEIIIFLDDDALIEKNFLASIDSFFLRNSEIDILGGPQLTPETDGFFARSNGYVLSNPFAMPAVYKRYKKSIETLDADSSYITGALLICRRNIFKSLNFNRNIYPADDVNLINLAKEKGFKVAYSPDVFIYHRRRANLKALIKQIFDYAKSRTSLGIKKQTNFQLVLFSIPSLFVLYLLLLPTLLFFSKLFLLPLLAYILLALVFSIYEGIINKNMSSIIVLPFIFLTVHVSYGLGFLSGTLSKLFK